MHSIIRSLVISVLAAMTLAGCVVTPGPRYYHRPYYNHPYYVKTYYPHRYYY